MRHNQLMAEVDSKLVDLWRSVDGLMKEADEKTAWMKRLREGGGSGIPLMQSDTPALCWQRICEHYRAIGDLLDIKHKYQMSASRKRRQARKTKA